MKTLLWALLFSVAAVQSQTPFLQKPGADAARLFLESLHKEQKEKVHLDFNDTTRTQWSNLPMEQVLRHGIWLKELSDTQKIRLHALLQTALSAQGYQKVMFIIQFDEDTKQKLTAAQNPIASRYGQEKYWITIFGEPGDHNIWGWKFEGHHLSLNFTYSPKGVTCTPMFIGINPAMTTTGPFAGRYLMRDENENGKQLFASLSASLQQKAIQGKHPDNADPMAQTGKEAFLQEKTGISFRELNAKQQILVKNILEAWIGNLHPDLAAEKLAAVWKQKNELRFAWMGTNDVESLHYYRLSAPGFVIEMTNRDGGLQHIHSLWRNLKEDFAVKK